MTGNTGQFNPSIHLMRGIGILLVVLGHSLGSVRDRYDAAWADVAIKIIFSFHMPLFFFISGFLGKRVFLSERKDFARVVERQCKRLVIPFFFYSALGVVLKLGASGHVQRPIDPNTLASDILLYPRRNPALPMWFLYALFEIQMLSLAWHVLIRVNHEKWLSRLVTTVILVAANIVSRYLPHLLGVYLVAQYSIYFYLGFVMAPHWAGFRDLLGRYRNAVFICGLAYAIFAFTYKGPMGPFHNLSFLYAAAGIFFTCVLGVRLSEKTDLTSSLLSRASDYSYAIYLNHGHFHMPFVIVSVKVLGLHPLAVLPFDLAISTIGPVLLTQYVLSRNRWLRRIALGEWKR